MNSTNYSENNKNDTKVKFYLCTQEDKIEENKACYSFPAILLDRNSVELEMYPDEPDYAKLTFVTGVTGVAGRSNQKIQTNILIVSSDVDFDVTMRPEILYYDGLLEVKIPLVMQSQPIVFKMTSQEKDNA